MAPAPFAHRLRVAHLNPNRPTEIDLTPNAAERQAIADDLGILALPALHLTGTLQAEAGDSWGFEGRIEAKAVQECVVSLVPVETSIAEAVRRRWSPYVTTPEGDEAEMGDDETDPLEQFIDMGAVMVESLALALPPFPRAPGAALPDAPEESPEPDTRRPFADLARLIQKQDD
ncbi:MAG: DUF177 domain-containing protein [Paracoccus sp. (in: a-proteobacteria)]|uniref:YceD family protein n=1 Tax=Paracoccus sp. TaxID=267 RepID=UPI0026E0B6B2|nr:DUF177 domain-containing protein [Paracoccus sp. (in: a-proteobacteria)]MDO5620637.1 DUF177 domain-containing protein [Paracoccus sp. (in: a-proteobacteria)]